MKLKHTILHLMCYTLAIAFATAQQRIHTEVLVAGGGTGGTAAGIQCARMGVQTIIVEESPWLGGMIAAAGVSAIDGNHKLPSGLWKEFRDQLYKVYGGAAAVETGWVSNTLFEPHVADSIFKAMCRKEKNLRVLHGWRFEKAIYKNNKVQGAIFINSQNETLEATATITIDATELGDLMASAKVPYDVGMEAGNVSDENVGITVSNNIVQDLTYVAILKDYGKGADCTIAKPDGYLPEEFDAACTDYYINPSLKAPNVDGQKMLNYGRLPHQKFMLNWPNAGNDTYLNIVEMTPLQRTEALKKAKATTLRFIYFIQTQLGFKHIGIATDEFPTTDHLALMPYHREGRRLKGLVRMNIKHIANPFQYGTPLYRTGISVGDYPIDHHHKKNTKAPQHLDFYPIPSYNIPLGALIPANTNGLIVAEKGISVSNVVNGTTRLQPVVLLTGQAAGTLAALSILQKKQPQQVQIRSVQMALLKNKAYIMPYIDVMPDHPHFMAIQQVGATGLLKGKGIPYKWANQTWFYPDSLVNTSDFIKDFSAYVPTKFSTKNKWLTADDALEMIYPLLKKGTGSKKNKPYTTKSIQETKKSIAQKWELKGWGVLQFNEPITRGSLATLLQTTLNPFETFQINHLGNYIQ